MNGFILLWASRRAIQFIAAVILMVAAFAINVRGQFPDQSRQVISNDLWFEPNDLQDTSYIKRLYANARRIKDSFPDSAMVLFHRGLQLSQQANYPYGQVMNLLNISRIEQLRNHPVKAVAWRHKALPICREAKQPKLWASYYLYGIDLYENLGYFDTAIAFAHKSLGFINRHPDWDSAENVSSYLYFSLGSMYMSGESDPMLAIKYLQKAAEAVERNKLASPKRAEIYAAIGGSWANSNRNDSTRTDGYRKGLELYFKAAGIAKQEQDTSALADVYVNIGGIYRNLNLPDSAILYLDKIQRLPDKHVRYGTRVSATLVQGMCFELKNDYSRAISSYKEALSIARKYQHRSRILDIEGKLYLVFEKMGQYKNAFTHMKAYVSLHDSLLDEEKIKATQQLEVKFRTAEKDKELALKTLKLTKQQSQLREKNIWIGAGGLSTLLLVGLLLVWRRNSQHRRKRQEERLSLMQKEQQLWKQGEEIRQLNAMVKGEERERARLGRELHDGIVSQLTAVKMNLDALQLKHPVPEIEHRNVLVHLEDIVTDLRKTAHNLVPGILLEHGLVPALESYCEKTAGFTGLEIDFVYPNYIPRMQSDFELSLYRMAQELVQNVIKHAHASRVLVQIDHHDPMLILTVEDDGKGMPVNGTSSDGIGLSNIKSRVQALQGRVEIRDRKGKGTSIYLEFDLSLIQSLTST